MFAKLIAYFLYYISFLAYYGFFLTLTAGHFYFYLMSFDKGNCYAFQDKNNETAYLLIDVPGGSLDVSNNFRVVNLMGFISFFFITLTMMYVHFKMSCTSYYSPRDCMALWMITLFLLWACYYLTLLVMRLRHAGKVCSGDYLDHPRLFDNVVNSPYIHDNGLFLWYSMIS